MNKIKLKDVSVVITKGTTPSTVGSVFIEDGINYVKSESVGQFKHLDKSFFKFIDAKTDEKLKRSRLKENDLLFSIAGAYLGKLSLVKIDDIPANTNQAVGIVRIDSKKADVEYLYYYFSQKNVNDYINNLSSQSSQPNLNLGLLGNLFFDNKPLKYQHQIAKVLSDLDAKIELNNKINAELEAMAKLIYDYWFVQFDFPFDFAQGKAPDKTSKSKDVKPYKSSGGKMVYNEELKKEIPEGWEVKELGEELLIKRGISYKSSEIKGEGIPMISLNSFNLNGTYKSSGIKMYSGKYADKNLIEYGDLLIAVTDVTRNADIIGKAILVPDYYSELVCSMDIAKVIPSKNLSESYLMMLFNTDHYHNYIKWFASGTIVLHLNMDGMKWYKAEIPPKSLLEEFDKFYKPIAKRISETAKQNQELSSLRDWLLPMLMNGQVSTALDLTNKGYEKMEELGVAAEGEEKYEHQQSLTIPENKKGFAKLVLAGKIIKECKDSQEFTNIKFQKLQHLAEHLMEADLKLNYYNQAAGPYDNRFMHTLHNKMRQQKWFESKGYKYSTLEKVNQIDGYFNNYFGSKEKQFSKIITLLGKASEDQCEIISTLYAVWNDRLIKGKPIEEKFLIEDFLEWSERKKKYSEKQLHEAIQWMKDKGIEPKGFGELIKHAKKK